MQHQNFSRHFWIGILCAGLSACGSDGSTQTASSPGSGGISANSAPVISGQPVGVARIGQEYLFEPTAYDPDGDTLTFRISNRPEWATFSPITGRFRGTPPTSSQRLYENIEISVTDGAHTATLPRFQLAVETGIQAPPNSPPTIGGEPPTAVVVGNTYDFTPVVSDSDGQVLVFSIVNKPEWAEFDSLTGRLFGAPSASQVGVTNGVAISVSDGFATVALPPFSISVGGGAGPISTNRPPTISGNPPGAVSVGQAYVFRPTASDPDGQSLTFSVSNKPVWANFNDATGELGGTPGPADVGLATGIVVSVSDGQVSTSLPAYDITVLARNSPPRIEGTPPTRVTVAATYDFTPIASDPEGQTLTFSIVNRPSWAQFNSTTGRLTGTPTSAHVGTYPNVSISVSDGAARATLPAFSITVDAANRPPVINGAPSAIVTAGHLYEFTPAASDPDSGQTLFFSITNQPGWATFDSSTGRLSGTPARSDIGTFAGIVIAVSDGSATASLPSFGITVADPVASTYFTSSFETGDKSEWNQQAFGAGIMAVDNTDRAYSGTHYVRAAMATGSSNNHSLFHDHGVPSQVATQFRDYWMQFAVSMDPFDGPWVTNKIAYVQQYDASQGDTSFSNAFRDYQQIVAIDSNGRFFVQLTDIPAWRFVDLHQNTSNGRDHGPTVGSWDVLRMEVILETVAGGEIGIAGVSSGTTAGNGTLRVWKNGTLILEYTNLNLTKATPTVASGRILLTPHNAGAWAGSNTFMYWDDVRLTSGPELLPAMPSGPVPRANQPPSGGGTGSATLSWTAPTLNEDGSPLANLSGYRVYYGSAPTNLNTVLDIPNPGVTNAVVDNLTPATWYFAVKAYNSSNVESRLSNTASKTIY